MTGALEERLARIRGGAQPKPHNARTIAALTSNVPVKFPDGWETHQAVLTHLHAHRIAAP